MTQPQTCSRRKMIGLTGKFVLAGAISPQVCFSKEENSSNPFGVVVGDRGAAKVGENILRDGGNAIDAAIAAAFAAGIVSPANCGVGGYGGHAVIALAGGKKLTAIDFNSAAPSAARDDMFSLDASGKVKNDANVIGWLAVGVPGTLAGLELVLHRYGTRSLRDVLAPTIQLCEEGTHIVSVKGIDDVPAIESASVPPAADFVLAQAKKRNVALLGLLKTLAERNSVESFYNGDIARKIADAFRSNGGLVTVDDLASYRAREVEPLKIEWNGMTVHTAPLTSPGLMLVEAISFLKAVNWQKLPDLQRLHSKLEALRIAWADRQHNYGDPDQVKVPIARLRSGDHVGGMARKILIAVKQQQPVPLKIDSAEDSGTTNISAADRHGNMIAITLTHGSGFGARVAVDELGMVLGHGMWRFNPRAGRPNSPGPGKRAVNNMCPCVVTKRGKPVLAVGGAGGTRIPNSVFEVLVNYVGRGEAIESAMAAPRLDNTGGLKLGLEKGHPPEVEAFFKKAGYSVSPSPSAYVGAASFDPATGKTVGIARGGS